jgi:hypothetical protein
MSLKVTCSVPPGEALELKLLVWSFAIISSAHTRQELDQALAAFRKVGSRLSLI